MLQNISDDPKISGTRNLEDNISDLKAQLASNKKGISLISMLIDQIGISKLIFYMVKIQENAKRNVQQALTQLSLQHNLSDKGTLFAKEYMDDGSFISLKLSIGNFNEIEKINLHVLISENLVMKPLGI